MNPWIGRAAAALIAGGAGFAIGRGTAPPPAAAPEPTVSCADEIRERDEEREIRQLLERELYGEPIPWPAAVPPERTEAGYRTALAEVVAGCRPGWTVGELECAEPPCIAAVWPGEAPIDLPPDCVPWTTRYGAGALMAAQLVDCDGTEQRLLLVSPIPTDTATLAPLEVENRAKRMKTRWGELRLDARCPERSGAGGATAPPPN